MDILNLSLPIFEHEGADALQSTLLEGGSGISATSLKPDQDHDDLIDLKDTQIESVDDDPKLLRAKVLSLELELKIKNSELIELKSEVDFLKIDKDNQNIEIENLRKEKEEAQENLEATLGRINAAEIESRALKDKMKLFGVTIREMKKT